MTFLFENFLRQKEKNSDVKYVQYKTVITSIFISHSLIIAPTYVFLLTQLFSKIGISNTGIQDKKSKLICSQTTT